MTGRSVTARPAEDSGDPLLDCLVALARLHGRPMSAEALSAGLPLPGGRLTPQIFVRAAERAGMAARVIARPLERFSRLALPAVLLTEDGREACVLTALDGEEAELLMDASGDLTRRVPLSELGKSYAGMAILVAPPRQVDDRAGELDSALKRSWFWGTLYRYRADYARVLLASLMINLFVLASPLFVMNVYDRVVPNNAIETLWVLAIGAATVFLFDFTFRTLRAHFMDSVGRKVDVVVSGRLFEHVLGLQLKVRPASAGSFANNVREFEALRDFFASATLTMIVDLPFAVLFLAVIAWLDGPLVLIPLFAFVPVIALGLALQGPLTRLIDSNFKIASQKHGVLVEAIDGLETVKATSAEAVLQAKWEQAAGALAASGERAQLLSATGVNFTVLVQQLVTIGMVVAGVYRIGDGLMTLGGLVACTILSGRALAPLGQVSGLFVRFQHARVAYRNLCGLMALPVERPEGKSFVRRAAIEGDLEFSKVMFRYPRQPVAALDGCTFRMRRGERVAILGRVGSGKSTVARMTVGLYEPEAGAVLLDGIDVRQIDPADLRRHVGYVPQDVKLFYGTVRDNILMNDRRADGEALLAAARIAGVDKIVSRHPSGFDLPVGEQGRGLSGGQRQAVAIARALLPAPGVLVMDEPTSAMDFATEQAFLAALADYLKDRTLLLVTHKPTLLALVDRIVVLDAGRVVADGPKDKVLQALGQQSAKGSA